MKNYLKIIFAELLSESTIVVVLSLWYVIWAVILNFGLANSSHFGNFPFIILLLNSQTTRMELNSLIKLPIKRSYVCFIKPIKIAIQFLALHIVKIISLYLICQARFDELISGSAMLIYGFIILAIFVVLAKEISAHIKIKNEYLHNWLISLIAGGPVFVSLILLISGLISAKFLIANIKYLVFFYLLVGLPTLFILFRNRKEYIYFSGSPEEAKFYPLSSKNSSSL